ncbi:nitrogen regulatory IIA protein [Sphingobacterium siyangense]|uniref:Nitrogen regulatory IIA protein n=1 Tax=Sphingobacterium siyangense TaxID=459529 RepID=A0A420FW57_9SPHI|nr:TraL conjugative transposon family protein [Sphingobacterium siyangense]RKF37119.1 nitrogen regulatory IIA protein [Sphingobacterium siyangense]
MKNFRNTIESELEKLDNKWQALPLKTQCRYVIILFAFYLTMGIGVLVKVCYDLGKEDRQMEISHIESPSISEGSSAMKDSSLINYKKYINGRERK